MLGFAGLVQQTGSQQAETGQLLAEPVVQFLADSALFANRNFEDFALQLLLLADIQDDSRKQPLVAGIDVADRQVNRETRAVLACLLYTSPSPRVS